MKEPRILFSCNHNLVEHGLKKQTIAIVRDVFYSDMEDTSVDMLSAPGAILSIDKIYQIDDETFSTEMFYNHCDYEVEVSDSKISAQIIWNKEHHPKDGTTYYVDIKFHNDIDIKRDIVHIPFEHTASDELISGLSKPTQILCIKGRDRLYYEGADYTFFQQEDNSILINWRTNFEPCSCIAVCFSEETVMEDSTTEDDIEIDEDAKITMKRSSNIDCPRCGGTGWYVGLFEKNCYRAKGVNKLLQDFIKLMYSVRSEEGYSLLNITGRQNLRSTDWLESILKSIVLTALTRYNDMITEGTSYGKNISQEERIYSAGVSDVEIDEEYCGAQAKVTIVTLTGYAGSITIDI